MSLEFGNFKKLTLEFDNTEKLIQANSLPARQNFAGRKKFKKRDSVCVHVCMCVHVCVCVRVFVCVCVCVPVPVFVLRSPNLPILR